MPISRSFSRRQFLEFGAIGVSTAMLPALARAADQEPPAPDLLIRGGDVIDPATGTRGRRDVAITQGRIASVESSLPGNAATRVIEAAGKLVVPGLIDLHTHIGRAGDSLGLPIDELTAKTGTTTCVSAGDVGYEDFDRFHTELLARLRTRTFAFLHISRFGLQHFPAPEMLNIDDANVERAAAVVAQHPDVLLGIKVRQSRDLVGSNGFEPLRRAIAAAEMAGKSARVMCHIGNVPGELSDLLELMRPGDIITHTYSGSGNNIVSDGKVLPAALAAKARGVIFDVGHGGGSFDYTIAEPAIAQGLVPDTISSDLHHASIDTPGNPYLPWVMSKFLHLGFSLDDVIAMTTSRPAGIIDRVPDLGSLRVGAPANVTILEMVEGPVTFSDTRGHQRTGERYLRVAEVIRAGRTLAPSGDVSSAAPSPL